MPEELDQSTVGRAEILAASDHRILDPRGKLSEGPPVGRVPVVDEEDTSVVALVPNRSADCLVHGLHANVLHVFPRCRAFGEVPATATLAGLWICFQQELILVLESF